MNKRFILIILITFLALGGLIGGVYLTQQRQEIREKAASATQIYFSPATVSPKPGENFTLGVLVNTGENFLAALSLEIIYDQNLLEAKTFTFNTTLLPTVLLTPNLSQPGKIMADAGIGGGTAGIKGTQEIATVTFTVKPINPQNTKVSFNQNSTKASTAIDRDQGINLISNYGEAQVVIAASPPPTATPIPPECVNNEDCNDNNPCTTETCVGGACQYSPISCGVHAECNPDTGNCQCFSDDWENCDGSWNNGCEANLTNEADCGACGNQCGGDEICQEKECVKVGNYPTCLIIQMSEALGIDTRYISIVENTDGQWSDACLGCPESEKECLQAITSGKKLVLKSLYQDSNNKCWQYEYHTAGSVDNLAIHCAQYRACEMKEIGCPQCPANGDFNGDGVVDEFDAGILIAHFTQEGSPGEVKGDANCDGVVDEFDAGILIAHFGEGE